MADRISTLPDPVLSHIVSFLPTKVAVATSVLSKRWKPLWRSIPTLDFDDSGYSGRTYRRFIQSVFTTILSRDLHQPIHTFRLNLCWPPPLFDITNVIVWINAVVQRRVEHLDLSMPRLYSSTHRINLPSALLNCRTLVVLKLKSVSVTAFSSVNFPSLNILHLNRVHFLDHRHLAEFLSACPNLEDLEADVIYFISHLVEAEFKTLPKLLRADIVKYEVPVKVVSNVEFLRGEWIDFVHSNYVDQVGYVNPCYEEPIPVFHNLTHIELFYEYYTDDYLLKLVELLKHCPKLQHLVIDKNPDGFPHLDRGEDDWPYDPQTVPKCLSLHLKACCLNYYKGSIGEFRFARYIVQNAVLLQTMTICTEPSANWEQKFKMIQEITSCTRCSATCKLLFE